MPYSFDFTDLARYRPVLLHGLEVTLGLTCVSTLLGCLLGVTGAVLVLRGPGWLRWLITAYIELIRNTPFIVQLFFVFFGLPSLGIQIDEMQAALLAMTLNLAAYAIEIVRAGIQSVRHGQYQAALSLGLSGLQAFRLVIFPQALAAVFPALLGQIVMTMLGSAVVAQISVQDLSYAANFIQSRNFRSFECYIAVTLIYLLLAILLRQACLWGGRRFFSGHKR
jgi:polar amino acid transport system permease protein